jgi:hypothetical protein
LIVLRTVCRRDNITEEDDILAEAGYDIDDCDASPQALFKTQQTVATPQPVSKKGPAKAKAGNKRPASAAPAKEKAMKGNSRAKVGVPASRGPVPAAEKTRKAKAQAKKETNSQALGVASAEDISDFVEGKPKEWRIQAKAPAAEKKGKSQSQPATEVGPRKTAAASQKVRAP